MILHIIAALVAALLALTGVSAEDETLSPREVVTDNDAEGRNTPSELPGPSRGAGN